MGEFEAVAEKQQAGPPPRPPMSDTTPPPEPPAPVPGGILNAARVMWLFSFLLGVIAIAVAFLSRNPQIEAITQMVRDFAPEQSDENLQAAAAIVFWGCVSAMTFVLLIEFLLFQAMMRRHGSARWLMLAAVAIQTAVVLLSGAFISAGVEGIIVSILVVLQLVLAGMAFIVGLLPGTWAWFRRAKAQPAD